MTRVWWTSNKTDRVRVTFVEGRVLNEEYVREMARKGSEV
jgi:hypothetical protein